MPSEDYAAFSSGALKLKGTGVEKKKKKKKPKAEVSDRDESKATRVGQSNTHDESPSDANEKSVKKGVASPKDQVAEDYLEDFKAQGGKTEAERRFEEQRKRRLNERMQREGVKTHKERVEDLNRYLSTLSEHHDMPRIGPG